MSALFCFASAGLIFLLLVNYHHTHTEEIRPEPVIFPDPVTTIEHRPNLRNGDRVFVQVALQHAATRPPEQLIPLAKEQVSLWALSLEKTDDAFRPEEYAKLRSFLHFEGVRIPSVVIAPMTKKDQTISPVEQAEKNIADAEAFFGLRDKHRDTPFEEYLNARIRATYGFILDPKRYDPNSQ